MMKKTLLSAILMAAAVVPSMAQTMRVNLGSITYAHSAEQTGHMPFASATTLTIQGKAYNIADITSIVIDNTKVADNTVERVTVDMLVPRFSDERFYVPNLELRQGTFVSMGNPHYVIFTDRLDEAELEGPRLERHAAFPERCNIEFARLQPDGTIRTRVWERGSGITLACGTGACATAVAAAYTGRAGRQSTVVMDGGTLIVEWRPSDGHVLLTGPAEFVFDGEIKN